MQKVPDPDDNKRTKVDQVAIIAFWRLDAEGEFDCYKHFKVPNPMKREIRRSGRPESTLAVKQVLYHGRRNEIYFFYKEPLSDEEVEA